MSMKDYAPVAVRLGMSAVFLWFGFSQIIDPANFRGYLPGFLFGLPYANSIVMANGIFEVIFGTLLGLGIFTRIVAIILAVHLISITFSLGYGETAVRDFGLAMATASIALGGADIWSLERKILK